MARRQALSHSVRTNHLVVLLARASRHRAGSRQRPAFGSPPGPTAVAVHRSTDSSWRVHPFGWVDRPTPRTTVRARIGHPPGTGARGCPVRTARHEVWAGKGLRVEMGWRDRDWAKFTDDERNALLGRGSVARPVEAPLVRRRASRSVVSVGVMGAAVVAVLASAYFNSARHPTGSRRVVVSVPPLPVRSAAPKVAAPEPNLVRIRWRQVDLAPAAEAGRICVTPTGRARICASYVSAEVPADVLTRRVRELGLRVESIGA
jgi:hypothetical protein